QRGKKGVHDGESLGGCLTQDLRITLGIRYSVEKFRVHSFLFRLGARNFSVDILSGIFCGFCLALAGSEDVFERHVFLSAVLRLRLLCHSFDHAAFLDPRMARGRGGSLSISGRRYFSSSRAKRRIRINQELVIFEKKGGVGVLTVVFRKWS